MSPLRTRELLEHWLDALGWIWDIRISRWVDETLALEEERAA